MVFNAWCLESAVQFLTAALGKDRENEKARRKTSGSEQASHVREAFQSSRETLELKGGDGL